MMDKHTRNSKKYQWVKCKKLTKLTNLRKKMGEKHKCEAAIRLSTKTNDAQVNDGFVMILW